MDINEAGQKGTSLADLIDAARDTNPISVEGVAAASRLGDRGIAVFEAIVNDVKVAQDANERSMILGRLMDADRMMALGAAFNHCNLRWTAQLFQLQGIRGLTYSWRELVRQVKIVAEHQRLSAQSPARASSRLDKLMKGLGVKGLREPGRYRVDTDGVWLVSHSSKGDEVVHQLAASPLVIIGRSRDVHDGSTLLTLAWQRRGVWIQRIVPRLEVMEARQLVKLAQYDAPVDSTVAAKLVQYLSAFEAANIDALKQTSTTPHMGWNHASFLVGPDAYGDPITLATEGGLQGLAAGWRDSGTWDGWCDVVEQYLLQRPMALLGIYAAACTPLLRVLNQPGFVMDWSGETSRGKTSTLRCAASVWGKPDDRDGGIILGWASSSMVGPIAATAFLQSLPVILDDTKRGKHDVIGAVIYDVPAGQERLRGTVDGGLRRIKRWRTCLLSTGEAQITSFSQDAGARARCICLRGSPFGEAAGAGAAAEAVTAGFLEHYGHAGRRLVQYIIGTDQDKLRSLFDSKRSFYASKAENAVAGRMASYVAVLDLAADMLHDLGMPAPENDPLELAWEAVVHGSQEADTPAVALRAVHDWAAANQTRFWGRHERDPRTNVPKVPSRGFAGVWNSGRIGETALCFNETTLESILRGMGHIPAEIVGSWYRRGWLEVDAGRRKKRVRIDGELTRMVAIKAATLERICSE